MSDEDALIAAILETPHEDAYRLVYADWLEERGDVRAEYLRREVALASTSPDAKQASWLRASMKELRWRIDPAWLAVFEQPGIQRVDLTSFVDFFLLTGPEAEEVKVGDDDSPKSPELIAGARAAGFSAAEVEESPLLYLLEDYLSFLKQGARALVGINGCMLVEVL